MRQLILTWILMVSSIAFGQYSNHDLYQAYLKRDMQPWQQYIASAQWDELNDEEQKQLLNYEYGFAAYYVSHVGGDGAEELLSTYENHIHACKGKISDAEYHAHLSGLNSYKLSLDKSHLIKYSSGIFDNIERAMDLDDTNPFVLTMQGNVEFYSPFGSKRKALTYYLKADSIYHQLPHANELWNLRAVQMTIVQCLEKLNRADEAKQRCAQYLEEEPNCLIFQSLWAELNK